MRFGFALAGLVVLSVLSLVAAIHGPSAPFGWLPSSGLIVVGVLVFLACFTGMMIAHMSTAHERADHRAKTFANANVHLEKLVGERTRALSEKVAELEQSRAEAVAANAAKSRFLATMSHELRTPLNAILGFSELIHREMLGPVGEARYVDYAQHIHQSGSHLLSLVGDILDISKIEAGKMEIHCEPLVVGALVEETLRLIGERADAEGHTIGVAVEQGLPMLSADKRATVQMLVNLLSNAIKFTPPTGTITIAASQVADGGVCINVRDTGIGIAKQDIPKALAVYSQIRNVAAQEHKGTGLGLPIVNAMMELHGGMLQLESEAGKGTSVSLLFPPERSLRGDENPLAA